MSEGFTIVPTPVPEAPQRVVVHGIVPPVPRVAGPGDDPNDTTLWCRVGGHDFFGYTQTQAEEEMNG